MQIREDAADHYLQEHPDPTCPDRHATQRPPNQYSFTADLRFATMTVTSVTVIIVT